MRILPRKTPRSEYLLSEETSTSVDKTIKKARVKGGFSPIKKMVTALVLGLTAITGTGTAAMAATADAKQAQAIEIDLLRGFCNTIDSPGAYLAGTSPTITAAWNQDNKTSPVGNGINISILSDQAVNPYVTGTGQPKPGVQWTALEQYGYYAPSFENWKGQLYETGKNGDDKIWPFVGTGGSGDPDTPGAIVAVTEPTRTPMFMISSEQCLVANVNTNVGIGNFVFYFSKLLTAVASETYGMASNVTLTSESSPLHGLVTGVNDLITGGDNPDQGLRQLLFLDWIVVIILVGTIGLIISGIIRRRALQTAQSALWMIGASVGGILLLFNPMLIPTTIDNLVGEVSSSVTAAILPSGDTTTNLCNLDETGASASIRQVKCSVWYSTIYSPWVKGQFGVNENDLTRHSLGNVDSNGVPLQGLEAERAQAVAWMFSDGYTSSREGITGDFVTQWPTGKQPDGSGFSGFTYQSANVNADSRGVFEKANIKFGDQPYQGSMNWAVYMLDRQNNWGENVVRGADYSEIAFNQLVINRNGLWGGAGDAIGSSLTSVFASMGPGLVLLVLGLTLIGYQLSMLFLIALSPAFLLAGVAPGWGRRISMRWLELLVGLLIKRIILIIMLVLYIKLYMIIIFSTMDWWIQVLITIALTIIVLTQRGKINGIFTDVINFGGSRGLFDGGEGLAQEAKQKSRLAIIRTGRAAKNTGSKVAASRAAKRQYGNNPNTPDNPAAPGGKKKRNKPTPPPTPANNGAAGATPPPVVPNSRKEAKAAAEPKTRRERREKQRQERAERIEENSAQAWQHRKASYQNRFKTISDDREKLRADETKLEDERKRSTVTNREYAQKKRQIAVQRKRLRKETDKLKKRYKNDASFNAKYDNKPIPKTS